MDGLLFLLVSLSIGYLMYWTITNERAGSQAGQVGWLAMKQPQDATKKADPQAARSAGRMPLHRHPRPPRPGQRPQR